MKRLCCFSPLIALSAMASAQVAPLPAIGKCGLWDLKSHETSVCSYVQAGMWDRPLGARVTAYGWVLGGLNLTHNAATGGIAGVVSSHGFYIGGAVLSTAGQPTGLGLVGGVSGRF